MALADPVNDAYSASTRSPFSTRHSVLAVLGCSNMGGGFLEFVDGDDTKRVGRELEKDQQYWSRDHHALALGFLLTSSNQRRALCNSSGNFILIRPAKSIVTCAVMSAIVYLSPAMKDDTDSL